MWRIYLVNILEKNVIYSNVITNKMVTFWPSSTNLKHMG